MKYKHTHVRYLREGMTLSERFFSVVMAKQVFGKVCPDWMWQRVHEDFTQFYHWQTAKYILANKVEYIPSLTNCPPVLITPCLKNYKGFRNLVACYTKEA